MRGDGDAERRRARRPRPRATALLAPAFGMLLLACTASAPRLCHAGEQPAVIDSLYFGTARPGGVVSTEEWQQFLAEVITPRFPQGLTSWAAAGQWRGGDGDIEKESSYVLHVVHPDRDEHDVAIREVIELYKRRFDQQAVMRVRSAACVTF